MQHFYLPTELITGCGTFEQLGKQAPRFGRRALLCAGPARPAFGLLPARGSCWRPPRDATVCSRVRRGRLATVEAASRAREATVEMVIGWAAAAPRTRPRPWRHGNPGGHRVGIHGGRKLEAGGCPLSPCPPPPHRRRGDKKRCSAIRTPRSSTAFRDDRWFARVPSSTEATLSIRSVTGSTAVTHSARLRIVHLHRAGPVTDAWRAGPSNSRRHLAGPARRQRLAARVG
jgi:hypothetical protein